MNIRLIKEIALIIILAFATYGYSNGASADNWRFRSHAVTLWWVIFNSPEACVGNPTGVEKCSAVDVFGQPYLASVANGAPDPSLIAPNLESELAVIYGTGAIADRFTSRVRLTASIYRSDGFLDLSGDQVVDPMGLGQGFTSRNAEVHLVVRDHGLMISEGELLQITNFLEPYCADPRLLYEGDQSGETGNICADVQFAVFASEEAGMDSVLRFADGKRQKRAAAYLIRQGDMLQAVVETEVSRKR